MPFFFFCSRLSPRCPPSKTKASRVPPALGLENYFNVAEEVVGEGEVEAAEVAEVEEPAGCVSVEEVSAGTPWGAVGASTTSTDATLAEEGSLEASAVPTASSVAWVDTADPVVGL